ncbi:LysR family transcriptional regulator [Micromonospora zingiberis]|uniref:LysR family transcriptional regulator n=1 Tax=Micromonospora zingiberis TaxID=2053011 RepID=A0A4R0GME2_9ACTN|nr:LysR family transcriptional regulator [Micromonospora zingiberis]TCB96719.1 LysR family transcriptional regulator [Micromonospora zingiberis]
MSVSLDLEHLRTLVAIADCGGFGRASVARHISQPALSQHVRLLERSLNRKLFARDGRGMKLTADGEQVLAEARKILAVHDEAAERLQLSAERIVVIGSSEHSAEQMLPTMISMVNEAFPGAVTRFEIGRSTLLAESVAKGSVDFAIILASRGNEGGYELGRMQLRWYQAPGWTPSSAAEVLPLVAFEEPCALRERAMAALATAGLRVAVAGQSSTLDGVLAGVRAGLGVALLPTSGGQLAGLVVHEGLPAVGTVGVNLLTRRGLDPAIKEAATLAGREFFRRRGIPVQAPAGDTASGSTEFTALSPDRTGPAVVERDGEPVLPRG